MGKFHFRCWKTRCKYKEAEFTAVDCDGLYMGWMADEVLGVNIVMVLYE